jgi:hypothetical protein
MKEEIVKLLNDIKININDLNTAGIDNPIIDEIYDIALAIEDIIYNDDEGDDEDEFNDYDY